MANRIQLRRGTEAEWAVADPILAEGEVALSTDTIPPMCKYGDGVSSWTDIPYSFYSHPSGDGTLHVPATGSNNSGNVLMAGATPGSIYWGEGGGSGGANLVLLAHSNIVASNTDTDYSGIASASFYASALRIKKNKLKIFYIEKGNGNCQFSVTDGVNTVVAAGTNVNSSTDVIGAVTLDCTTLAYGAWWDLTVNSKAVSGAYEIRRLNIMADPASPMSGNAILLSAPGYPINTVTPILVERRFYPTNYLIDANANIALDSYITVTSGTVTLRCVVTPVMDMAGTLTTPPTSEEASISTISTGNVSLLVPAPTILAPMIRIDIYGTGVGSIDKLGAWAEV